MATATVEPSPDLAIATAASAGAVSNIYTPLLLSSRTTSSQPPQSSEAVIEKENVEDESAIAVKKLANKGTGHAGLSSNPKSQRSAVRPFLCCGSELSLVSLVDSLELTDGTEKKREVSIECNSSSEEEDALQSNVPGRKVTYGFAVRAPGEPRGRRKKKDKKKMKKRFWNLRFRGRWSSQWRVSQPKGPVSHRCDSICSTSYQSTGSPSLMRRSSSVRPLPSASHLIDLSRVHDFDRLFPTEDIDDIRIRERAEEMAAGIEVDAATLTRAIPPVPPPKLSMAGPVMEMLRRRSHLSSVGSESLLHSPDSPTEDYSDLLVTSLVWQWQGAHVGSSVDTSPLGLQRIHTQIDFIHCLVPDLARITSCSFYWGIMDRYEAERLLENKPEGTFLLRDSAQEDFLFSVSFRRYARSLHARVEQWNHRFSFDAHDPGVFSAPTICDLMEHYKDSSCCMFFEPMLTLPLHRNFPFSLQHLCRATICDQLEYDNIRLLPLPNSLKQYLQVYHYKQKVCVRRFDDFGMPIPGLSTNRVI